MSLLITTAVFAAPPRWKNVFGNLKTIAICAPGRPGKSSEVDLGIKLLQEAGYKVKIMPHARNNEGSKQMVDAKLRTADLVQAWFDPEVDAIFCVRGGSGSEEVAAMLDWEKLRSRKLPVAGFSDITSLHWAMTAKNCGTVMALPMFSFLKEPDKSTLESLDRIFKQKEQSFTLPALRGGEISGLPLPGNLTVATSLCGTSYFPDTTGRILVLEEVREAPYRIDRMLNQLLMCGAFDRCAGVVFGYFTTSGSDQDIMKVLEDFTGKVDVPVFYGLKFGHEQPFISIRSDRIMRVKG